MTNTCIFNYHKYQKANHLFHYKYLIKLSSSKNKDKHEYNSTTIATEKQRYRGANSPTTTSTEQRRYHLQHRKVKY
jgi:hypothetical protein